MIDFAILILINVFVIVGFYKSTEFQLKDKNAELTKYTGTDAIDHDSKMFLWWVRYYSFRYLGKWSKPITMCIFCMASLHSLYVYFSFYDFDMTHPIANLIKLFVYMLAVCGGVTFIDKRY